MKARYLLAGLIGLVLALMVTGYVARDRLAMLLLSRGAEQALAHPALADLKTGLHAGFCGTGSPMPDRARAGPCLAVIAGGRLFVFDAGEGAAETMTIMGLPPGQTEAVFLTHFHSDHIDGLGALGLQRWATKAAREPLPLYGPTGVEQIAAGLAMIYGQDKTYRIAHHGSDIVPASGFGFAPKAFAAPAIGEEREVYQQAGVKITAFGVDHRPVEPAVGYRVTYQGQSLVISGDTKACDCVMRAARGANLLIHESIAPQLTRVMGKAASQAGQPGLSKVMGDIETYHATPEQVAQIGAKAGVKGIALTHIVPPMPIEALKGPFLGNAQRYFKGPIWIMRDGELVSLDTQGRPIRRALIDN